MNVKPSARSQPDQLPVGGAIIESVKLLERACLVRDNFLSAQPFPHIVIDDFLPCDVAERLLTEYPSPEKFKSETTKSEPRRKGKLRSISETEFTPFMRLVLHEFNSPPFIQFLERLSGVRALVPDPDIAGALRHFGRGGRLGIHADFNFHSGLKMHRRIAAV